MMNQPAKTRTALERWLFENHVTLVEASKFFGCSNEYVRLIAQGRRNPSPKIAAKIMAALTGVKTVDEFRREAIPPAPKDKEARTA